MAGQVIYERTKGRVVVQGDLLDVPTARRHEKKYSSSSSSVKPRATGEEYRHEERLAADFYGAEIVLSREHSMPTPESPRHPAMDSDVGRPGWYGAEAARPAAPPVSQQSRSGEGTFSRRGDASRRSASRHTRPYLLPRLVAYYQGVAWTSKPRSPIIPARDTKSATTKRKLPSITNNAAGLAYDKTLGDVSKSVHFGNPEYVRSPERFRTPGRSSSDRYVTNSPMWSIISKHKQRPQLETSQQKQKQHSQKEHQTYHEQEEVQQHQQPRLLLQQQKTAPEPLSESGERENSRSRQIILPNARSNSKYSIVYVRKSRVNPRLWAYYQNGNPSKHTQTPVNSRNDDDVMIPSDVKFPSTSVVTDAIQTVAQYDKKIDEVQNLSGKVTTHPKRKQVTAAAGQHDFRLDSTDRQRWNLAPRLAGSDAEDVASVAATSKPGVQPTKVVLVTYMRGGSSLLGQLLNYNPRAVYWFEPLDAVYSCLYATAEGWLPLDIAFDPSRELRRLPAYEEDALVDTARRLLDCDVEALPTEVLTNYFLVNQGASRFSQLALAPYAACIKLMLSQRGEPVTSQCNDVTETTCARHFGGDYELRKCHEKLEEIRADSFGHDGGWGERFSSLDVACRRRESCVRRRHQAVAPCLPLLRAICNRTQIRSLKSIRLRLQTALSLVVKYPDVKVIYYVRDPRAIMASRWTETRGLVSSVSGGDIVTEAQLLCRKMHADIRTLRRAHETFPNNFMMLRYEDLALDVARVSRNLYGFIQQPIPPELRSFIFRAAHARSDNGFLGTNRKDMAETAGRWKKTLPVAVLNEITVVCQRVLSSLGYPSVVMD